MVSKVSLLLVLTLAVVLQMALADVTMTATRLNFGRWSIGLEGDVLVFRDTKAPTDSRVAFYPLSYIDLNGRNGHVP